VILGRHYTPAPLAAEVVRRTLGPLRGRSSLRILDPACGEGVFLHEARRFLGPGHELVGVDVDPAALSRAGPGLSLREGDALRLDWGGERFDAVVGNPPWVSFSGRHAAPLADEDRAYLRRFETFAGWPSLHAPFVELSIRLGERVGLLLPAQVCELERYGPLRGFVRRHCRILKTPQYGEEVFAGVIQPTCALILERGSCEGGEAPFTGASFDPFAHCARPPPHAFADFGVHTGNCAAKLIGADGIPVREGKDIDPFVCRPPRKTLRVDYEKQPGEYFRIVAIDRYRSIPILLRQTAPRPVAALHVDPTYYRNSLLGCRGIDGVPDQKVVAWLNSSPVGWYHRRMIREASQRAFPQVKLKHLRDLPLPDWNLVRPGEDVSWEAFGLPTSFLALRE